MTACSSLGRLSASCAARAGVARSGGAVAGVREGPRGAHRRYRGGGVACGCGGRWGGGRRLLWDLPAAYRRHPRGHHVTRQHHLEHATCPTPIRIRGALGLDRTLMQMRLDFRARVAARTYCTYLPLVGDTDSIRSAHNPPRPAGWRTSLQSWPCRGTPSHNGRPCPPPPPPPPVAAAFSALVAAAAG